MNRDPLIEAIRELNAMYEPLPDFSAYGSLMEPAAQRRPDDAPVRHSARRNRRQIEMHRDENGLHATVHNSDGTMRTVHMRRDGEGGMVGDIEDDE
jgi:hypothetical protein